jgi:hypothetical protein
MGSNETLRPSTDRLASLLADERGSEILMALCQTGLDGRVRPPATASGPPAVANRSTGARRIVLVGDSVARGCPFDTSLTCAIALEGYLVAEPGAHRCEDLTQIDADADGLIDLVERADLAGEDVVVAFLGNEWAVPPEEIEFDLPAANRVPIRAALSTALRGGGYPALRQIVNDLTVSRYRRYLDRLAQLQATCGVEVMLIIPEFNLLGWAPPAEVEIPVLDTPALSEWYRLRDAAQVALDEQRWADVASIAQKMRALDAGSSPVPGQLSATAALRMGDEATARTALEDSRDAVCGLMVHSPPRATSALQWLLATYAAERGWPCVDLRSVLATSDGGLPDPRYFHDCCHLSDVGVETAMAAVADAVLGYPVGTTPARAGRPLPVYAFGRAHAAVQWAYSGQPAAAVVDHLRAALRADPDLAATLTAVRDLLSAPHPRWSHPVARRLADDGGANSFAVALAQTGVRLPAGLWVLRQCLSEVVGPEQTGDCADAMDLLLGPHCGGQPTANWTPSRCHLSATTRRSSLPFPLDRPRAGTLELTYRTPGTQAGTITVLFNGVAVETLKTGPAWMDQAVVLPAATARAGINRIDICWPIPMTDLPAQIAMDAAALARGQFPYVLPTFGQLFTARVRLEART